MKNTDEVAATNREMADVEFVEDFIRNIPWSVDTPNIHKTLIAGNLRNFWRHVRETDNPVFIKGIESVRSMRCMNHRAIPQLNTCMVSGGECPVCALQGHVPPDWDKSLQP